MVTESDGNLGNVAKPPKNHPPELDDSSHGKRLFEGDLWEGEWEVVAPGTLFLLSPYGN